MSCQDAIEKGGYDLRSLLSFLDPLLPESRPNESKNR
jgi:hypothetical protein